MRQYPFLLRAILYQEVRFYLLRVDWSPATGCTFQKADIQPNEQGV